MSDTDIYAMNRLIDPTCRICGKPYVEGQDTEGNPRVWHRGGPVRFNNARALDAHHTPERDHGPSRAEWVDA